MDEEGRGRLFTLIAAPLLAMAAAGVFILVAKEAYLLGRLLKMVPRHEAMERIADEVPSIPGADKIPVDDYIPDEVMKAAVKRANGPEPIGPSFLPDISPRPPVNQTDQAD